MELSSVAVTKPIMEPPRQFQVEVVSYFMVGGLIFQEHMSSRNTKPSHPRVDPTDQAVFLSEILPHDVNYGYETWKHAIAIAVNGDFFSNVAEMKALVDAIEHGLIEIEIL